MDLRIPSTHHSFLLALTLLLGSRSWCGGDRCDSLFESEKAKEVFNKGVVLAFYRDAIENPPNFRFATPKYIPAKGFIQHNPTRADGREAYMASYESIFGNATVGPTVFTAHMAGDGNLVWLHKMNRNPSNQLTATINIFRLDCGLIVEHWDVIQSMNPNATYANPHPFF